jgi:predicted transcriptional regulator
MKRTLHIGVMSRKEYMARTIAIAKGEYVPKPNEPKIWFESTKSMAEVLSNDNRELLALISKEKPQSLKDLEVMSGRKSSNLSRTLKTMERFGIVTLIKENKHLKPIVNATDFRVELGLTHFA